MTVGDDILDEICAHERYREILAALGSAAMAVVALVVEDDLTHEGVAQLFGISRAAVSMRLTIARARLLDKFPELARYYGWHGRKMERCPMCGAVISVDATWCRKCWHRAVKAIAATEDPPTGQGL